MKKKKPGIGTQGPMKKKQPGMGPHDPQQRIRHLALHRREVRVFVVVKGPYVLAEVRCLTRDSFWPRSGAEPCLLRVGDRKSCNAGTDSSVPRYDVGDRWRETDSTRTVLE